MLPILRAACVGTLVAAAAQAAPDLDLVIYGATGCVGGLAAQHLAKQAGLRWAVAGRNATKLAQLASDICSAPGAVACPEQIVAPLDEQHDPADWVRRARAVVTAAGPFSVHGGERLVEACAQLGVHYADTSDEFYWQREMVDRYDGAARASGARVVFSAGFCALVGDLGAQLALSQVGSGASGAPVHVDAWLETYNGGVSAGVLETARIQGNASFPKEWAKDPYVLVPEAPTLLKVDTSVTGLGALGYDAHEGVVTQNIFGPYDARLLRRTFVTLGQVVSFRAGAPPSMYVEWAAFLAKHPGSWASLATCPSEPILRDGAWQMRVRAATGSRGEGFAGGVLLSGGGDPGYHFTAWGLAEVGLCLAGRTPGCLRSGGASGVLTTMGALEAEVVRARLEAVGLLQVEDTPGSSATFVV